MRADDTILASASSVGFAPGGRAVIRMSGTGTFPLLGQLLEGDGARDGSDWKRRGVRAARLRLSGHGLPCIVMTFVGPKSYTGEDGAEIVVPANPMVVDRVTKAILTLSDGAREMGVRIATPGEFTARAYLHDRLSLAQAEGVAAMIGARGRDELLAAQRMLRGETGAAYRAWTNELMTVLALVEAGIDFTDQEDVVAIDRESLLRRVTVLVDAVRAYVGHRTGQERQEHRPVVVLAGKPNAGKSTLFNALLGNRRAVVSPVAGTTRDVLREELDLAHDAAMGGVCTLCDVAGLEEIGDERGARDGEASVDAQMQRLARGAIANADVVVWCDPTGLFEHGMRGQDAANAGMVEIGDGQRVIRVRTKGDLVSGEHDGSGSIAVCALDGWNLGVLRRAIADAAWGNSETGSVSANDALAGLPRHSRVLAATLERLESAMRLIGDAATEQSTQRRSVRHPELVAGELRLALDHLGELTGEVTPDDVIGRIFATFCIGK